MTRSLVLLAAGLASRYGSSKQTEEIGPSGEWIIDYTIYDALRAGFQRIVVVVRPETESMLLSTVRSRFPDIDIVAAQQRLEDLPPRFHALREGRTKPWGTGQAVLAAAPFVDGRFAVANADDFYGASALDGVGRWVARGAPDDHHAHVPNGREATVVSYRLVDTLSPSGGVNRAVCETDTHGDLRSLREATGIRLLKDGTCEGSYGAERHRFAPDTPISMNLWGFSAGVLDSLRASFDLFLQRVASSPAADRNTFEFLLPTAVGSLISSGEIHVHVMAEGRQWCGLTHPADRAGARATIARLVAEGQYPSPLQST